MCKDYQFDNKTNCIYKNNPKECRSAIAFKETIDELMALTFSSTVYNIINKHRNKINKLTKTKILDTGPIPEDQY